MPKQAYQPNSLVGIAGYHKDAEASLRLYFSCANPEFAARFATYLPSEVASELAERLQETNMRSSLVVMARVEAAFRIDYKLRSQEKKPDPISVSFRKIHKARKEKARLDADIWEVWRRHDPSVARHLIGELKKVFKFRHWIAHGRHWPVGNKYDFQTVYLLADTVLAAFPLRK